MKRDYREKTVKGMIADVRTMMPVFVDVTVRMTSDKRGQSLSMSGANVMIEIPLEGVRNIIKVTDGEEQEEV